MTSVSLVQATDESAGLILACARGDRTALRRLYDLWSARLYGLALRITRQPSLAADATHDAFLQVWQHADRFDPERGSAAAWLTGLVRYRALDIVRRRGREVPGYEPQDEPDEASDPLQHLLATDEGAALLRCLQQLRKERRDLIVLAFVEGLSHSELAARLGLPLGTVKSWVRRGLMSLRGCLES